MSTSKAAKACAILQTVAMVKDYDHALKIYEALGKSLVRAHLVNQLVHLVHRCWPASSHRVNCCWPKCLPCQSACPRAPSAYR